MHANRAAPHLLVCPDGPNMIHGTTRPPNGRTNAYALSSSGSVCGAPGLRTGSEKNCAHSTILFWPHKQYSQSRLMLEMRGAAASPWGIAEP